MKDLFQIYEKWCKRKKFDLEISYISEGTLGWARVEFIAKGNRAYEQFLPEAGGHRFQRVPYTEKRGRYQTSTVTVSVLPLLSTSEIKINPKDLEWGTFKCSGPGGQNVNKLETGVRITHKPTGIMVKCQEQRKQGQNKVRAMEILVSKLKRQQQLATYKERSAKKKAQVGTGQRGDKVRTYRYRDAIVTDHITGRKHHLNDIISGNLDVLRH